MPRMPRLDLPGHYYHVIVRGVERRPIFRSPDDRHDFLSRLVEGLRESGSLCFAWTLMTNHLHLLLLSGARGLSSLMHPLLTGYVGAFNRRHKRVGHLVQNRYKSLLCQADRYFLELVRYIHLNPVRGGLVKTLEELRQYPWTGHVGLMGTVPLVWQATDPVLSRFGSTIRSARTAYEQFLYDRWNEGVRDDLEGRIRRSNHHPDERVDARILGEEDFVEKILTQADDLEREETTLRRAGITMETLQATAAETFNVSPDSLERRDRRRPVARARALFIYAATELLGRNGQELAQRFRLGSTSVSEARQRGRQLAEEHQFLKRLEDRLEGRLRLVK